MRGWRPHFFPSVVGLLAPKEKFFSVLLLFFVSPGICGEGCGAKLLSKEKKKQAVAQKSTMFWTHIYFP